VRNTGNYDPDEVLVGAIPLLVLLGIWQWVLFGSPVLTAYQASGLNALGRGDFDAFFSLEHVLMRPAESSARFREVLSDPVAFGGPALMWTLPNALIYPLQLSGADGFLVRPGVGLVGLLGLVHYARRAGPGGWQVGLGWPCWL
jgi:hypothetical protein